jgi:hypothetical protein
MAAVLAVWLGAFRRSGRARRRARLAGRTSLSLAVPISVALAAARSGPRSDRRTARTCGPRRSAFGGVVGQTDPAAVEEAGETVPSSQHVVDLLDDGGRTEQARPLGPQPGFSSMTSGALLSRRRRRSAASTPLLSHLMSNSRSMRLTASSAKGDISARVLRWRQCRPVRRTVAGHGPSTAPGDRTAGNPG